MGNLIAAGFQNTVDFELDWDPGTLAGLCRMYGLCRSEIREYAPINSERELLLTLLFHMQNGSGSECLAVSSKITRDFAARFEMTITLGGTAVRAAMAIEKLGYKSSIHACSLNRHFRALIPENVTWVSSVSDEGEDFHPHVIVQYPGNCTLQANDIEITTKRPNRVIFTCDPPSEKLIITDDFADLAADAKVFLTASYNIVKHREDLVDRLNTTLKIMDRLSPACFKLMEDGCFRDPRMREIITEMLVPRLTLFSMNEDELQDRIGRKIDILNPVQVAEAVKEEYAVLNVPILVCHSACWALAYGKGAGRIREALEGGVTMASTRFRLGDHYDLSDYRETAGLPPKKESLAFIASVKELLSAEELVIVPAKDLSGVPQPVTIGLGDSFIGGMLPLLLPDEIRESARFS
ncbi:MAG: hypothetical protein IJJ25_09385 [Lachnospiraceae bacterium]|nr:hypothetical protein [Lachnospiraceae bacterium]